MGAFTYLDPSTVRCLPGKCLVEIVEVLGGKTRGGIVIPEAVAGKLNKDTFYGRLLQVGPAPRTAHYKSGRGPGWDVRPNTSGAEWPSEIMDNFQVGDIIVFPRDVELVFVWEQRRFGICHIHEAIMQIPADSFDPDEFEVVPWRMPGS